MLPRNKKVTCSEEAFAAYKELFRKIEGGPVYVPDIDDLELISEKDLETAALYLMYIIETVPETAENKSALVAIRNYLNDHVLIHN